MIEQILTAVKEVRDTNDTRLGKIEIKVDPVDLETVDKACATVIKMEAALHDTDRAQPVDVDYRAKFAT